MVTVRMIDASKESFTVESYNNLLRIQRNESHLPKLGKEYRLEFRKPGILSSMSKGFFSDYCMFLNIKLFLYARLTTY